MGFWASAFATAGVAAFLTAVALALLAMVYGIPAAAFVATLLAIWAPVLLMALVAVLLAVAGRALDRSP